MEDQAVKATALSNARNSSVCAVTPTNTIDTGRTFRRGVGRGGTPLWGTSYRLAGLRFCGERKAGQAVLNSRGEGGGESPLLRWHQWRPA